MHKEIGSMSIVASLISYGRMLGHHLRASDPSNLRGEAFDVILLALKHVRGDEHREVAVLHTKLLDFGVKPG